MQIAYYVIGRFFFFHHHYLASLGGKYSLYILKAKSQETIAMFQLSALQRIVRGEAFYSRWNTILDKRMLSSYLSRLSIGRCDMVGRYSSAMEEGTLLGQYK